MVCFLFYLLAVIDDVCFYQGSFVLCRLFKKADIKQEENTENSNVNGEVEEIISSPTPTIAKPPAEDEQSESITPAVSGLVEMQPSSAENSSTLNSENETSETHIPPDWFDTVFNADSHMLDSSFPVSVVNLKMI